MSSVDRHHEDVGAYLLGALEPSEQAAFEQHLAGCPECRADVEELRVAADALPRSVEPYAAPASLKRSLMEAVREDAREQRPSLAERVRALFGGLPPQLAWVSAAFILAVGIALGVAGSALTGDDGSGHRVVSATVDRSRVANATATVSLHDEGPAQLRVTGLPKPRPGQVYEVWLKRGAQVQPGPLFNVDAQGNGVGAIPDDLTGVTAILVTREKTGGAQMPSEAPIISARI